jgi:hypothetical protein
MAIWLRGASAPRSKQNWPVPLDAFQRDVLAVLSRRRTPSSPVAGSGYNFYQPVPDPEFGWRLHFADLAVNKVLAAASRRQPRDFVDLYLVHNFVMPLWHAVWASPGKDAEMTPEKAIERVRYHSQYPPDEFRNSVFAADEAALPGMISNVRTALDDAEQIIDRLPRDTVGKILVDAAGRSIRSPDDIAGTGQQTVSAAPGGTWPSGPDIDHFVIEHMIAHYGRSGEKLWVAEPTRPAADS